jgi:hypothetical protein
MTYTAGRLLAVGWSGPVIARLRALGQTPMT